MIDFWEDWVRQYPIFSLEDPLDENDWDGWKALTEVIGNRVQIVGDDLFVTNVDRLRHGIRSDTANAVLINGAPRPRPNGMRGESPRSMCRAPAPGKARGRSGNGTMSAEDRP